MDKVNALQDMASPESTYASVIQKENFPMPLYSMHTKILPQKIIFWELGTQLTLDLLQELRIIEYVCTSQTKHVLTNLRPVIQTYSSKTD